MCAPVGQRLSFKCPGQKEPSALASSRKQTRFSVLSERVAARRLFVLFIELVSLLCLPFALDELALLQSR